MNLFKRKPRCAKTQFCTTHHGWDCPLADPIGDMRRIGAESRAKAHQSENVSVPMAMLVEMARYNPGCVMPESYGPSMYQLAQAVCEVLDHVGVKR